jgi:mRNA-degrading endonuclease RelE of RelBE toxin-antitoxin system
MARARKRPYRRTWKNLLINKRYQLRFTLFMVVLSALLMGMLGWWVMTVAARATTVAVNNVLTSCQGLPGAREAVPVPTPEPKQPVAPAATPADPDGDAEGEGKRRRPVVTIDDSGMKDMPPAVPPAAAPPAPSGPTEAEVAAYRRCTAAVAGKVRRLEERQRLIFRVLVGAGGLLAIGLLLYGIKMTHRVAGPLHKVTLYMSRLRGGNYDVIYNLRKGDHLVEFYDHFKAAHAGMRGLQEEDVARLRALVAAAEEANLAGRSPEMVAALDELRAVLDRKEKSLG